jgi:hypothetical protein
MAKQSFFSFTSTQLRTALVLFGALTLTGIVFVVASKRPIVNRTVGNSAVEAGRTTPDTINPSMPGNNSTSPNSQSPNSMPPASSTEQQSPIAYVGGSLTTNAVDGYRQVGGNKFWIPTTNKNYGGYGGGTVTAWASGINGGEGAKYWQQFQSNLLVNSNRGQVKYVWFELLSHGEENFNSVHSAAASVINEIKRRIPGVLVYVSGMNGYDPAGFCRGVTAEAPSQMNTLADKLVREGLAVAGPRMGNLTRSQVTNVNDGGCHANSSGKELLGRNLLDFFK